jgi:hypothetical protein
MLKLVSPTVLRHRRRHDAPCWRMSQTAWRGITDWRKWHEPGQCGQVHNINDFFCSSVNYSVLYNYFGASSKWVPLYLMEFGLSLCILLSLFRSSVLFSVLQPNTRNLCLFPTLGVILHTIQINRYNCISDSFVFFTLLSEVNGSKHPNLICL